MNEKENVIKPMYLPMKKVHLYSVFLLMCIVVCSEDAITTDNIDSTESSTKKMIEQL